MVRYFLAFSLCAVASLGVAFCEDSQSVTLQHTLQVPGATLEPGNYTFSVEDRLQDRAIIRITSQQKDSHELLLAVPTNKLPSSDRGKLLFFPAANSDKQILQGWMCPGCQSPFEVVYAKDEAVAITGETAKPVMAVDPTYDKLPANLSPDDMKVVTLWLLSPKEITADQKGKGVQAAKYADVKGEQQQLRASVTPPKAPGETSAAQVNRHMPHTASNTYSWGLAGLVMLLTGALLRFRSSRHVLSDE